jgi:hypothetical protein
MDCFMNCLLYRQGRAYRGFWSILLNDTSGKYIRALCLECWQCGVNNYV